MLIRIYKSGQRKVVKCIVDLPHKVLLGVVKNDGANYRVWNTSG